MNKTSETEGAISGFWPLGMFAGVAIVIVKGLGSAFIPLLIAAFLAYLALPGVKRLMALGVKKPIAVGLTLLGTAVFWAVALTVLVPILIDESRLFLGALPEMIQTAARTLESLGSRFGFEWHFTREDLLARLGFSGAELSTDALKSIGSGVAKALTGAGGLMISLLNFLLVPIFYFHLLSDYEVILDRVHDLVPPAARPWGRSFVERANLIISSYFRGQILVSVILSCLYGGGFAVVGLRFGFLVGILTGCLNVIPYVGPMIGLAVASAVALSNFESIGSLLSVWGAFAVVQSLESFVITPKIVGDRVGLSPLEAMLALIVGGNLAGFGGMLVAIPTAGIIKEILKDCRRLYFRSSLYSGGHSDC